MRRQFSAMYAQHAALALPISTSYANVKKIPASPPNPRRAAVSIRPGTHVRHIICMTSRPTSPCDRRRSLDGRAARPDSLLSIQEPCRTMEVRCDLARIVIFEFRDQQNILLRERGGTRIL